MIWLWKRRNRMKSRWQMQNRWLYSSYWTPVPNPLPGYQQGYQQGYQHERLIKQPPTLWPHNGPTNPQSHCCEKEHSKERYQKGIEAMKSAQDPMSTRMGAAMALVRQGFFPQRWGRLREHPRSWQCEAWTA